MIAVDSSVVVAAVLGGHPDHEPARHLVAASRPRLVAHVAFEAYSVLTRLPQPDRLDPAAAHMVLERAFPDDPLTLRARQLARLLRSLAAAGIAGGAVYDGLVAGTAREHDAELVTLDRRARATYATVGVDFRLLVDDGESDEPG